MTTYDGKVLERLLKRTTFTSTCWLWNGACNGTANTWYGQIGYRGKKILCHRFAWHVFRGKSRGKLVLHKCDVANCWRPSHLFLGTHKINAQDRDIKGRAKLPDNKGSRHGMSKLTEIDVQHIKKRIARGATQRALAASFNVSQATIQLIAAGKRWTHVT